MARTKQVARRPPGHQGKWRPWYVMRRGQYVDPNRAYPRIRLAVKPRGSTMQQSLRYVRTNMPRWRRQYNQIYSRYNKQLKKFLPSYSSGIGMNNYLQFPEMKRHAHPAIGLSRLRRRANVVMRKNYSSYRYNKRFHNRPLTFDEYVNNPRAASNARFLARIRARKNTQPTNVIVID